jgi:hypothetical protein
MSRGQKIMQWIGQKEKMEEYKQQQPDSSGIMSGHLLSNLTVRMQSCIH